MGSLAKHWAGRIYGTNTGNFFLNLEQTGPALSGTLRLLDSEYGLAIYNISGQYNDHVELSGTPSHAPVGVIQGTINATGHLTSEGQLRGEWVSSIGTGGVFVAYPHDEDASSLVPSENTTAPEQIYTHNIVVGAVSLYAPDVRTLVREIRKDFTTGRPVATYSTGTGEVTKYVDDFLEQISTLGALSYFKLQIQEQEAHGINRVVVIELRAYGVNEVRAQGINESWVIGRAEGLATLLRRHQNSLVTGYKKFGLNLNQVIFLAMLVAIPEIESLTKRAIFVAVVFSLLAILLWFHSRFIPNANIRLGEEIPSRLSRTWPTLISWLFAVGASVVAAYLYTWLTGPSP